MCGRESREVPGDHTCVTVHASGCGQPASAWVRLKGEGTRSVCLWFSRSRSLNQTRLRQTSLLPGCPSAHRSMEDLPACVPALPLRFLPSSHSPSGKETLLGTGADPALALSLPWWAEASFLLTKTTDEPRQKCIPRLFVLIALLYMTCFYSLLFHQPFFNLTYVPRRSTARENVSNPGQPQASLTKSLLMVPAGAWQSLYPLDDSFPQNLTWESRGWPLCPNAIT